jgi:hypothetical protein
VGRSSRERCPVRAAAKKPCEFLFSGRLGPGQSMTTRQYARLASEWVARHRGGPDFFVHTHSCGVVSLAGAHVHRNTNASITPVRVLHRSSELGWSRSPDHQLRLNGLSASSLDVCWTRNSFRNSRRTLFILGASRARALLLATESPSIDPVLERIPSYLAARFLLSPSHEHVTDAAHGADNVGVCRIRLYLAAQAGDAQVDGAVERLHLAMRSHLQ